MPIDFGALLRFKIRRNASKPIKVGDTVRLKSGGPVMVVHAWGGGTTGAFVCTWFDGSKRVKAAFQPRSLIKVAE